MPLLEPRTAGPGAQILTPILAVLATLLAGGVLFFALGLNPFETIKEIFVAPLLDPFSRSELLVKAAPLALIGTGLAFGFRAGIWNIGAEGQFIVGALTGGAVGLAFWGVEAWFVLPLMALAGALGGFLWAMIPALLRVRFQTNEILVSLMLVYVALNLLSAMVAGPLRDPDGFNFPESRMFHDAATLPILIERSRVHIGVPIAFGIGLVAWLLYSTHVFGYKVRLMGAAPRAAVFAGVGPNGMVILCLGLSGALAGLAGVFEAAGPAGQLTRDGIANGYGFVAIIVAYLGRLHPFGVLLAALALAVTEIGGDAAQVTLGLPAAATDVFQGMLLFFLLAFDTLTRYRVRLFQRRVA
ncbi:MAG: ABC transporter permease [Pseudomonadota bacterium]